MTRRATHTYHYDPAVPAFDDSEPVIIFDGHCVLCSAGVQWMLARDPSGPTRFAAVQEPIPRALYNHYRLDPDRFDTFMVLADGVAHVKWQGAMAAARTLPQPWRSLGHVGRLVPRALGDRVYDWVQRNRIAWFGSRAQCFVLDDGAARRRLLPKSVGMKS